MRLFQLLSIALVCHLSTISLSAQNTLKRPFSNWFLLQADVDLNSKFSTGLELHLRREDLMKDCFQQVIRPYIRYKVDEHIKIGVGYSFLASHPVDPLPLPGITYENNIWEEVSFHHHLGKYVHVVHRYRLEQRFIDHWHQGHDEWTKKGRTFENTLRYKLKVLIPVTHFKSHRDLYVKVFDDIWLAEQNNLMPSAFYENKFYVGLGWKFVPHGSMEMGYLNVYYDAHDADNHYITTNILAIGLHYTFNDQTENHKKEHPCTTH